MQISALSFNSICSPLPGTINLENCLSFSGLDLADYHDETNDQENNVLIGSDYYWNIVTGTLSYSRHDTDSSKTLFQQGSPFSQRLVSIGALHILKFTYDKFKNLHHAYYILYEVKSCICGVHQQPRK